MTNAVTQHAARSTRDCDPSPYGKPAGRLVVVWRVTEECDLGCRFCAYSRPLPWSRRAADPGQVRAFGEVLGGYAASARRRVLLSWMGGEPLLWPPLLRVNRALRRHECVQTALSTSGTALGEPALCSRLLDDFDEVTVSVDGTAAFHDAYRDAPGLYDRLRKALADLSREKLRRGLGPLLRVNTILTRGNVSSLEELCRQMAECGVEELTFNALGGRERRDFYLEHGLRLEDVAWLCRELPGIRDRMGPLGLAVCGSGRYLAHLESLAAGAPGPVPCCGMGRDLLFVDAGGRLGPCGYTTETLGVPVDEIRTPEDLASLPERFAERGGSRAATPCRQCAGTHLGKFERG